VIITGARFLRVTGVLDDDAMARDDGRALSPADIDPAFAARPCLAHEPWKTDAAGRRRIRATFLMLETDAGITGTATQIGPDQVATIRERLLPWLVGRDAMAIEEIWDFSSRLLAGGDLAAASTIDCALWDLRGKAEGAPVFELLGGPQRARIVPYAGMVGCSTEPAKLRERALAAKVAGFVAQKWYPPCSIGHGPDWIARNVAVARELREAVGDDVELMFDAHRGWTVDGAVEMARELAPFRPRWLEEPVMGDDLDGYRAVRESAGFPIAGAESHRNRHQAAAMLAADAVDVYQPEPSATCITEMMRIARLVADHGKQMAPHCGYLPTLQVIAALPETLCPYYECLWNWNAYGQWFYRQKCRPVKGVMPLPPGPGLGLELDDDRIESQEEV
jgi:L-alanine-DL-glutamate epimerase-like enolase superfamily enzyme